MLFGGILSELREEHGLKQTDLAKILHISNSSISAYENGTRLPNVEILMAMAKYFNVTTDYLLGITKNPISPTILSQQFARNCSVGELLVSLQSLLPVQKDAVTEVIMSMKFYAEIASRTNANEEPNK